MRKFIFLFLLLALSSSLFAQTQVINDFEDPQDSTFWGVVQGENATDTTRMEQTFQSDNAVEGSALTLDWLAEDSESWGGFVKIEHYAPDSMVYDWSAYDTVSFWYYNENPQSVVGDVHVRFNLYEASDVPDTTSSSDDMEFYYSFHYGILDDSTSAWHKISIPLIAGDYWNGEGFNRTGWSGVAGNEQLDTDKIKGYTFEFSIGGGGDGSMSEGIVIFDQLELSGLAEKSIIYFNGAAIPSDITLSDPWGGNAFEVTDEEASEEGSNSIKWSISPNDWATWSGANFTMAEIANYQYHWATDSVKLLIKAPSDLGDLKLIFLDDVVEDGDLMYEAGYVLVATEMGYTGEWQEIAIPLRDFNRFDGGYDGTSTVPGEMDSTRIKEFRILLADGASFGKVIYLDNVWVGNPIMDVVPPEAPTNVTGIAGTYQNLITWVDVPNEDGAVYNVVYSLNPITSLDDEGLEELATGVATGVQIATHVITAPLVDTEVTYYYAVYAIDAAGNDGPFVPTDAVSNDAKGIATIAPAFTGFTADGNLGEWSEVMPIRMYVSDGSGAIVTNTTVDGDADLSLDAWVAFDDNYLYFAADVEDDVIEVDSTNGETWMYDGVDLFIGLYNQMGAKHTSYKKGDEPDLHFRFNEHQLLLDISGGGVLSKQGVDYYWKSKFPTGYIVEGRVSLDTIAVIVESEKFVPIVGMKIPIDYSINDADGSRREGIMTLSKINEDQSWGNPSLWTHTWIGDKMTDVDDNELTIKTYGLEQNYPNPFNPSTVISYSLAEAGMVTLKIYNILGQEVLTLVNTNQNVGQYQVKFDASNLSTGLYVYRIQSGNFVDSKKMMLLK